MSIFLRVHDLFRQIKHTLFSLVRRMHVAGPGDRSVSPPVAYHYSVRDSQIVAAIVRSGKLHHDQGKEMVSFEREFAAYTGAQHAIATNSGTSALMLAIQSLGLGLGDEVIVPAYAFVAAAQAVLLNAATPVFADIDATCTISPKSIERCITHKTKAIIVVHMFGNVADMDAICAIAKKHGLMIVEDCAQAIGAFYRGKHVGTFGDIGCFSFSIKKAIPTGQGGMVITQNVDLDMRIRIARNTGLLFVNGKLDVVSFGGTYFMTEIEAALGRSVLRQISYLNSIRKRNYEYLMKLLYPLKRSLSIYTVLSHSDPSYSRLSFLFFSRSLTISRDEFVHRMQDRGIPFKKFYPTPIYQYSLFRNKKNMFMPRLSRAVSQNMSDTLYLPFAEKFHTMHVGIEFSPYWSFSDMRLIAQTCADVLASARK